MANRHNGSGSLTQRQPGVWLLRVSGGKDPLTGRYVSHSRTFKGGKRGAEQALAQLVAEVVTAKPPVSRETFGYTLHRWLEHKKAQAREKTTLASYSQLVKSIDAELGHIPLNRITTDMLNSFYASLAAKGLKASTVQRYHATVNGTFNFARGRGWTHDNPSVYTGRPSPKTPDLHVPDPDEIARLIEASDSMYREWAMFLRLAIATWARRGELCGLRWEDVDFEKNEIIIRRSAISIKGKLELKSTKTNRNRVLAMDSDTMTLLEQYLSFLLEERAKAETTFADPAYLFSDSLTLHTPWHPDTATGAFMTCRKKAGVKDVRLHDLRHFGPTQALSRGVPIPLISYRLGHSSIKTTLDVYIDHIPSRDKEAAELMGRLLSDASRPVVLPAKTGDPEADLKAVLNAALGQGKDSKP